MDEIAYLLKRFIYITPYYLVPQAPVFGTPNELIITLHTYQSSKRNKDQYNRKFLFWVKDLDTLVFLLEKSESVYNDIAANKKNTRPENYQVVHEFC